MAKTRDGSEQSDHWRTPPEIYTALDAEFHFDFDPCPYKASFNGLIIPWGRSNFVNPPYNRIDKPRFIRKAFDEWRLGKTCVLLIPAAVSTADFHELILPHAEIRFPRGRIKFIREDGTARGKGKHDSMIVIYRGKL